MGARPELPELQDSSPRLPCAVCWAARRWPLGDVCFNHRHTTPARASGQDGHHFGFACRLLGTSVEQEGGVASLVNRSLAAERPILQVPLAAECFAAVPLFVSALTFRIPAHTPDWCPAGPSSLDWALCERNGGCGAPTAAHKRHSIPSFPSTLNSAACRAWGGRAPRCRDQVWDRGLRNEGLWRERQPHAFNTVLLSLEPVCVHACVCFCFPASTSCNYSTPACPPWQAIIANAHRSSKVLPVVLYSHSPIGSYWFLF